VTSNDASTDQPGHLLHPGTTRVAPFFFQAVGQSTGEAQHSFRSVVLRLTKCLVLTDDSVLHVMLETHHVQEAQTGDRRNDHRSKLLYVTS
jgi:hypothetical protein